MISFLLVLASGGWSTNLEIQADQVRPIKGIPTEGALSAEKMEELQRDLTSARGFLNQERPAEAVALLEPWLPHAANNSSVADTLTQSCVALKDWPLAQTSAEVLLQLRLRKGTTDTVKLIVVLGALRYLNGDPEPLKSLELYMGPHWKATADSYQETALGLEGFSLHDSSLPKGLSLLLWAESCYRNNGAFRVGQAFVEEAYRLDNESELVNFLKGRYLVEGRNYKESLSYLKRAEKTKDKELLTITRTYLKRAEEMTKPKPKERTTNKKPS